jgi:hypothetical protein
MQANTSSVIQRIQRLALLRRKFEGTVCAAKPYALQANYMKVTK